MTLILTAVKTIKMVKIEGSLTVKVCSFPLSR